MLIDTHCHLDFPEFDADRGEVLKRAADAGVKYVINIGSSLQGSINSVKLAKDYPNVFAVVGCHPHDSRDFSEQDIETVRSLAGFEKVVAIGEIGLDYYRNLSPQEDQKRIFVSFLRLARELNLPVVIHSREARDDTLRIMREENVKKAIIHCFGGDQIFLKECIDRGYLISFTCNVTYKKAGNIRDAVKAAPLEMICLETDAPYLSPEGYRGKRNDPSFVRILAQEISRIKGLSIEEISRLTTQNAREFFGLKLDEP
ncbi:MAG: TatD family hydrolase [Candidatus Omnitrophica bacterium]|nr:TatD family hydrolase [Candidatus Omnitrophota bacterium]